MKCVSFCSNYGSEWIVSIRARFQKRCRTLSALEDLVNLLMWNAWIMYICQLAVPIHLSVIFETTCTIQSCCYNLFLRSIYSAMLCLVWTSFFLSGCLLEYVFAYFNELKFTPEIIISFLVTLLKCANERATYFRRSKTLTLLKRWGSNYSGKGRCGTCWMKVRVKFRLWVGFNKESILKAY